MCECEKERGVQFLRFKEATKKIFALQRQPKLQSALVLNKFGETVTHVRGVSATFSHTLIDTPVPMYLEYVLPQSARWTFVFIPEVQWL